MAKLENLRFGVKIMPAQTPLDENQMSLYIKGEFGGETYGTYVRFLLGHDVKLEVPAELFLNAVSELQESMRQIAEELQKGGDGDG